MNVYYVTFGSGQLHGFGLHYHLIVEAPNELTARRLLAREETFGGKWGMIYDSKAGAAYAKQYGTVCLGEYRCFDEYCYTVHRGGK